VSLASDRGIAQADGVLMDLGISSLQVDVGRRGFSFRREAPLDMRFDESQTATAADVVNGYSEQDLANAIYRYGEERGSRRIARAIVRARPLHTTTQLAEVVARSVGRPRGRIHPATKTFQAIRMVVNGELENIEAGLGQAIQLLERGGRLAVVSYHSLEDRLVKTTLRRESRDCVCPPETPMCVCGHTASVRLVNRKVIRPKEEEVAANPRSRSARLRVAERT
ncbi:MAG: 16S rRNA (cytosine(1402)-N(4))-methyltransferase RsmH, partial [Chloroflexi bacterium]|nr:16S rRNA (cytosine(1402)-N(4))-methyltransferase RsmH [Chloroflexota bacterium]